MADELIFPSNASVNQQYVAPNGITYIYDGSKWAGQQKFGTPVITQSTYVLPPATATQLGGVKVGSGLSINNTGVLSSVQATVSNISPLNPAIGALWFNTVQNALLIYKESGWQTATENLPQGGATGAILVKNSNSNYDASWTAIASQATATKSNLGIVQVGDNINVVDGTISVPTATNSTLGVVKPGTNVTIDGTGAISVSNGAGINTLTAIPDVNSTAGGAALNDGALLIYNASNQRWDTINNLRSDEMDGGFF